LNGVAANVDAKDSDRPRRGAAIQGERKRKRVEGVSASSDGGHFGWIYDLVDPQEITDIKVFRERPAIF
jgi:hypothetical protein